jgi:hypothetical protein
VCGQRAGCSIPPEGEAVLRRDDLKATCPTEDDLKANFPTKTSIEEADAAIKRQRGPEIGVAIESKACCQPAGCLSPGRRIAAHRKVKLC